MPEYNYECNDCKNSVIAEHGTEVSREVYEECVLFVTSHAMEPTEDELAEALICPRCGSADAVKTFHGNRVHGYVRGYGFLDKAGAKRDMNMFHLTQDDPYSEYREAGEVDHLKAKIEEWWTA